jgi:hypothetical protein
MAKQRRTDPVVLRPGMTIGANAKRGGVCSHWRTNGPRSARRMMALPILAMTRASGPFREALAACVVNA